MKSLIQALKKPHWLLTLAISLVIAGSFFAFLIDTSGHSVEVSRVKFDTERGTLAGTLYMPNGAGAEDPRPVIITTHGYLNSKEMQDAPAVEMSRRGYIVLAMDMYDHGDSRWSAPIPVGGQFSTFWIYSQFDAAKYVYDQPYTKKDDAGNAYVAVSGHSMGGFSSTVSLFMDEMNSLDVGYRMIYTGISAGSDFSYAAAIASQEQYMAAFGDRTVGMIAGHYDEFFFNKADAEKSDEEKAVTGTVTYKDFAAIASGKAFLGLPADAESGEAGRFYTVDSGELKDESTSLRASQRGERIIYTPNETHPWNTFSLETTGYLIDFYAHAFSGVTSPNQTNASLPSSNQMWWLREAFTLVALIGFFLMFIPLMALIVKLPYFNGAVSAEAAKIPVSNGKTSLFYWVSLVVSALIPALLFPTMMDKQEPGLKALTLIASAVAVLGVVSSIIGFSGKNKPKSEVYIKGGITITALSAVLIIFLINAAKIIPLSNMFNQPTTNQIVYWAIGCGLISAILSAANYFFIQKKSGVKFESYGVTTNIAAIIPSFCAAVVSVAAGYSLLFIVRFIFGTDFRFYTVAVRAFNTEHLITALRYIPFFFIFYFINTIALNANTRGLKGGGYITSIFLNAGGLILWLMLQYGMVFTTGVALYPAQTLNGILLFGLVPCLVVAAILARRAFDLTHNVWLGAFLNTILFTIITAANTATFWNLM